MGAGDLLTLTDAGLYCPAGDFYIDPWLPVARAVITHAHVDHARRGSERYLTTPTGLAVLRSRLGADALIDTLPYGETLTLGGGAPLAAPRGPRAWLGPSTRGKGGPSLGRVRRLQDRSRPHLHPFEPVRCHTFVTESTFGLPIYRWPDSATLFAEINAWWRSNQEAGRASLLFAYALGKAQRLLAGIDATIGPIFTHGAVETVNRNYRAGGVALPSTRHVGETDNRDEFRKSLIMAPPSARRSPWVRRFGDYGSAFASGWMLVRGTRRRRAVDRGFVLSDHADWPGLLSAIDATGAQRVLATHGATGPLVRWLLEHGLDAEAVVTRFEGEEDDLIGEETNEEVPA